MQSSASSVSTRAFIAETPLTVTWDVTGSPDLVPAPGMRGEVEPDPRELPTWLGLEVLEAARRLGRVEFVFTGRRLFGRADVFELIGHAVRLGLRVTVTPAAPQELDDRAVAALAELGMPRAALGLDGASARTHGAEHRVAGSYASAREAIARAQKAGLPVEIRTTVTRQNRDDLQALVHLVHELGAAVWTLAFLVVPPAAGSASYLEPQECEDILQWLYEVSCRVPFNVRTAGAPHFRRVVLQREGLSDALAPEEPRDGSRAVSDGNGLLFVSHTGEVFPSSALPLSAGNVRFEPLDDIYHRSPLLRRLRSYENLGGRCGRCEFKWVCGGSRARAFVTSGDPLGPEPLCVHDPQ